MTATHTPSIRSQPLAALDPDAQRILEAELCAWKAVADLRRKVRDYRVALDHAEDAFEAAQAAVAAWDRGERP